MRAASEAGGVRRRRKALLATLATLPTLLLGAPAAASAAPLSQPLDPDGVRAYWTPKRMKKAIPLDGEAAAGGSGPSQGAEGAAAPTVERDEILDPGEEPFDSHGRVFFVVSSEGGQEQKYSCSGTALNTVAGDVVWTAGHCVYDHEDGDGFVEKWMFAPAYQDMKAPLGEWPASELLTTDGWGAGENFAFDLGAALVTDNADGETLADVVGGRGIAFNQEREATYESFGYPYVQSSSEFPGDREYRCTSELLGTDSPGPGPETNRIACDMPPGASGGGWIVDGFVRSVNSYTYDSVPDSIFGPYQGDQARALFEQASGGEQLCADRSVTDWGTAGSDRLVGTAGPDVFWAGGGKDTIRAKGGDDVVCAGGGKDVAKGGAGADLLLGGDGGDRLRGGGGADLLKGARGRDRLKGGGGPDDLRGGPGRDRCVGGGGRDSGRSCKVSKQIP